MRPQLYDDFDASKYEVSKLTFYLKRTVTKASQWPNDNAELRIVFSATSASDTRWYELRASDKANRDLLEIERTPSRASERESGIGRVAIVRSTPDRTIPVLRISYFTNNDGVNTQADSEKMFILDVRQLPPKLVTALECTNLQGGGVCTVWDNGIGGTSELACDWKAPEQNYWCEEKSAEFYGRDRRERFRLPGKSPIALVAESGSPGDVIQFAKIIQKDESWGTRKPVLPGLGETTLLFRTKSKQATAYVFGARGRDDRFNARFLAVVLGPGDPELLEIRPELLLDEPQPENAIANPANPAPPVPDDTARIDTAEMPAGNGLRFNVKKLDAAPPAEAWQVAISESDHHAVNWLVTLPSRAGFQFYSLKLASDGASYMGCNRWNHEQTSILLRQKGNSLEAEAEVDPAFVDPLPNQDENEASSDEKPECPVAVKIKWTKKSGFMLDGQPLACPAKLRLVKISDDGNIAAEAYSSPWE